MTATPVDLLTRRALGRMITAAVRDRSYVEGTGIGVEVDRFLRWFVTEYGAAETSAHGYEFTLARLALFHADRTLKDFEPPDGTELVRDFWSSLYQHCAVSTRQNRLSHCASFFRWAVEQRKLNADPCSAIRAPKGRGRERRAHPADLIVHLMACCEWEEDRVAVDLLGRHGLRRNELRLVQRRHVNVDTGELTVFGKGGTVLPVPLFPDLVDRVARLALQRQWQPDEFLLFPRKVASRDENRRVIWEDRRSPLSLSGIDKWWRRTLTRAGVEHFPMHEMRHTAGTLFYRRTRDLVLTQKLLRHQWAKTTADTYLHLDRSDLAAAMRELGGWDD